MKKTQLFILASILLTAGCSQTEENFGEGMTLSPDYRWYSSDDGWFSFPLGNTYYPNKQKCLTIKK